MGHCGSGKTDDKFIPETFLGAKFWKACKKHDECYDTYRKPKDNCDIQTNSRSSQMTRDKAIKSSFRRIVILIKRGRRK